MAKETKNTKVTNYGIYPVRVAVFYSEDKGVSVKVEKSFKNKDGEYQSTNIFNVSDLGSLVAILNQVIADQTTKSEKEF